MVEPILSSTYTSQRGKVRAFCVTLRKLFSYLRVELSTHLLIGESPVAGEAESLLKLL